MHAVVFDGLRYDTGDKLSYLKAVIRLALERKDLGPDLRTWLDAHLRLRARRDSLAAVALLFAALAPARGGIGGAMSRTRSTTADLSDFRGVSRRVAAIAAIGECVRDIDQLPEPSRAPPSPGSDPLAPPPMVTSPGGTPRHSPLAARRAARPRRSAACRAPRTARELGIARAVRCNRGMTYDMRSVDDQLARVLDPVRPLPAIDVGLQEDARGCILAEDVSAPWPLPPFDNAAMDGYAVLTGSVVAASPSMPVRLSVIEDIPAGSRPASTVAAGTAAGS